MQPSISDPGVMELRGTSSTTSAHAKHQLHCCRYYHGLRGRHHDKNIRGGLESLVAILQSLDYRGSLSDPVSDSYSDLNLCFQAIGCVSKITCNCSEQ